MRQNPADLPHVEKESGDLPMGADAMYRCTMYGGKFDREAYEAEGECPICADVGRVQENIRGGL